MRIFKIIVLFFSGLLVFYSCGVSGDPGHCYVSVDWEYYNEEYGVYYFEDDNPDVPDLEFLEPGLYYDSYPGLYSYYYEAEDTAFIYKYNGVYELLQNSGFPGGLFHDGPNGVDTYFDLFLFIYAKKGLTMNTEAAGDSCSNGSLQSFDSAEGSLRNSTIEPLHKESREWTVAKGDWILSVEEEVAVFAKSHLNSSCP